MKNETGAPKTREVEETVRTFYDTFGWVETDGKSGEDASFREFRTPYYAYHERTVERTLRCFSGMNGSLLLAGGGDLPESHLRLARQFTDVSCLDISLKALEISKRKLVGKGHYILGSILDAPPAENTFDAVFCAHVIYHIDIKLQERAIEELIRVAKPGGRIVIIYANPNCAVKQLIRIRRFLERKLGRTQQQRPKQGAAQQRPPLPFALHPLEWWRRFEPKCKLSVLPWDVMSNHQEGVLIHSDRAAALAYAVSSWIEAAAPSLAAKWWHYPIVILDKAAK
jgi:SAM-dependent methyltransferase